ncbi:hypothetical protein K439DRAFT_945168 [Ramaria rubella]|nr:hypothetical protein K439DRAFT_945168 [Ramaria rubella]
MPLVIRRSVSSPSVRLAAAPYPSPTSSAFPTSSSTTASARPQRRRRGASDATSRRVLADIEWWRVMQGQQEEEPEAEPENETEAEDDAGAADDVEQGRREPMPLSPRTQRLRTPEREPLYTLREDSSTSYDSAYEYDSSSVESTPPRAPPLPVFPSARAGSSGGIFGTANIFAPSVSATPTGIFAASVAALPAGLFATHTPPMFNLSLRLDIDADVGTYTTAPPLPHPRHRSASFPSLGLDAVVEGVSV